MPDERFTTKPPTPATRSQLDMRVAIAKDVILQLAREDVPLNVKKGRGYLVSYWGKTIELDKDGDILPHVDAIQGICTVCQLGAMLLSKARLYDGVPTSTITCLGGNTAIYATRSEVVENLISIFDPDQLDLIESAFERTQHQDGEIFLDAVRFGRRFDLSPDRALAICQNIIDYDGIFVPEAAAGD